MKLTRSDFFRILLGAPAALFLARESSPAMSRLPWHFDFQKNTASDPRLLFGGYDIFVNGVSVRSCFAANQAEGWARCYVRNENDEFILDGSDVRVIEYRGDLRICKHGWKAF